MSTKAIPSSSSSTDKAEHRDRISGAMASWLASTAKTNDVIPVTEVIAYILAPGEALPTKAAPQPVVAAAAPPAAQSRDSRGTGGSRC